jgi:hypothetical protein
MVSLAVAKHTAHSSVLIPYWQLAAAATTGGIVGSALPRAPKSLIAAGGTILGALTGVTAVAISHFHRAKPNSDRRSDVQ